MNIHNLPLGDDMSLEKLKDTFKSITLAGMVMILPIAGNDPLAGDSSESVTKTSTHQVPVSRAAFTASKELGTVGVLVNRGADTKRSEVDIRGLTEYLLSKQGLNNHHVVSNQSKGDLTTFTFYVDGESKKYLFSSLKLGIKTAKIDVDNSIRAAKHEATITRNRN